MVVEVVGWVKEAPFWSTFMWQVPVKSAKSFEMVSCAAVVI
jgi:hypothetical protein